MKTLRLTCAIIAVAALASSCLSNDDPGYKADSTIVATFQYSDVTFEGDSMVKAPIIPWNSRLYFYSDSTDSNTSTTGVVHGWHGGFGLSTGQGDDDALSEVKFPYRAWGSSTANEGNIYGFWHDSGDENDMPEVDVYVYVYGTASYVQPYAVWVNNTEQVVNQVRNGFNLADGPFTDNDYITLTISASQDGTSVGSTSVNLADFKTFRDSVITNWTLVDLSGIGTANQLSFSITSSREDIVKDFCFDEFAVKVHEEY